MPVRRRPTRATLLVALTCLAVGLGLGVALGPTTAGAAGALSDRTVRKIAAKVVTKKARKLTVRRAHSADTAATAADAQALAGRPDTSYLERRQVFTAAVPTPSHSAVVDLPGVGPGTYEVSYNAFLASGSTMSSECFLARRQNGADAGLIADSGGTSAPQQAGRSGTGVITLTAGQTLQLRCVAGNSFTTRSDQPIQVIVQPLDVVSATAVTATTG